MNSERVNPLHEGARLIVTSKAALIAGLGALFLLRLTQAPTTIGATMQTKEVRSKYLAATPSWAMIYKRSI
jgi:hypothetical protein